MKKLLILFLSWSIAILLLMSIANHAKSEEMIMYVISTETYVNVRESASTKGKIGGYLDFGWEVTVTDEKTDHSGTVWYRIDGITEQGYGYVCANYLIPNEPTKVNAKAKVNSNGRVKLYSRVNGKRKGWAKPGQVLNVKIKSDSWCLTDKGYIRSEYLAFDE